VIFYRLLGHDRQVEESGHFNKFVGERLSEVRVNSDVDKKWYWLTRNCNLADLGARRMRNQRISFQDGATRTACGG
jgi:hypothetical protein